MNKNIKNPNSFEQDLIIENSVRPLFIDEYIGQTDICDQMKISIKAAAMRNEALDHVLLFGPPGLGKTTLAMILAREIGANIKQTSGPIIQKAGDLAAILTGLSSKDVIFIDEIHRMSSAAEEMLYQAMEDYKIDIMIGDGPAAKSITINLPNFTLVGATTRTGLLTSPLRDRFGIVHRLNFYDVSDLVKVVERSARIMKLDIDHKAATEIASRSRGTPRIANRILRRVRDFAQLMNNDAKIDVNVAKYAVNKLNIDHIGLDDMDRRVLSVIMNNFECGPVGIDSISASLGEDRDTIESAIEPYLIQIGFLARTPRGRVATNLAIKHFQDQNLT